MLGSLTPLMVVGFLVVIASPLEAQQQHDQTQQTPEAITPSSPLPPNFLDHTAQLLGGDKTVPVDKNNLVGMLIGHLKNGQVVLPQECEKDAAVQELMETAKNALKNANKANRLVRAVSEKLNVTCDQIKQIAAMMAQTESHEHADKLRRAVEDMAVSASGGNPSQFPAQSSPGGLPPFLFGGGGPGRVPAPGAANFPTGGPGAPFRFGGSGVGPNPFFTVPMTAPALEMDLDRLMFISTPYLGINRAFELARILHVLGSPRSEVFELQEKFTKNVTDIEAADVMKEYQTKLEEHTQKTTGDAATSPTQILQNTAHLSGLNATESHRFARAISQTLGPINSTQAMHIHNTIRDHALNHTELRSLTNEIENLSQNVGTVTPENATGEDWLFSGNATEGKRQAPGLQSRVRMFSSERACGFALESDRGTLYPWMATLKCSKTQCAGTLVSNNLVLTSASCILACGTDAVTVTLGDPRISGCGQRTVEVLAVTAVVNPRFGSARDPRFDIGLLQIQTPVDFNRNPFIYPICLVGVETDDPSIECDAVLGGFGGQFQIQSTGVNCFQPGNQACAANGLTGTTACARLKNCFPTTQSSVPIVCRRRQSHRYYLWGVTTANHDASTCTCGVTRISDGFPFLVQGLGF